MLTFKDGFFDLKNNKFTEANNEYEYPSTNINYISKPSEYRKQLDDFLKSVIPDEKELEKVLIFCANRLAANKDDTSLVIYGGGGNGK